MLRRFVPVPLFILLFVLTTPAQTQNPRPMPRPDDPKPPNQSKDEGPHLPGEMLKKMEIARAEIEYKKVLEDVDKLNSLSSEIARGYGENNNLSNEDVKKLGTIEKLAKRVQNYAGGEGGTDESEEKVTLAEAIQKLNSNAADIKKNMTTETRFVVSASVIAKSNEMIHLARFIRRLRKN